MRICIITPAPPRSQPVNRYAGGNRVTALRWAGLLRELGHRVHIEQEYSGRRCDMMVALHAVRSSSSIKRFAREHANLPLIVALTGTDLYGDDRKTRRALCESLELATRLIALQPAAVEELPASARNKLHIIHQSVRPPATSKLACQACQRKARSAAVKEVFEVCVLGHLRSVKDPFRTALAVRKLPASSLIEVVQVGAALSESMGRRARAEMSSNRRYRWLGELPRWKAMRVLARSRLMVLSSRMEGGANVISEAIAACVPVIASRIPGSIGILGPDYPGYFPVGDTASLTRLLTRAETEPAFYRSLRSACKRLAPLVAPDRERRSWADLLKGLARRSTVGKSKGEGRRLEGQRSKVESRRSGP